MSHPGMSSGSPVPRRGWMHGVNYNILLLMTHEQQYGMVKQALIADTASTWLSDLTRPVLGQGMSTALGVGDALVASQIPGAMTVDGVQDAYKNIGEGARQSWNALRSMQNGRFGQGFRQAGRAGWEGLKAFGNGVMAVPGVGSVAGLASMPFRAMKAIGEIGRAHV